MAKIENRLSNMVMNQKQTQFLLSEEKGNINWKENKFENIIK